MPFRPLCNPMPSVGLIEENMEMSHIHLHSCKLVVNCHQTRCSQKDHLCIIFDYQSIMYILMNLGNDTYQD